MLMYKRGEGGFWPLSLPIAIGLVALAAWVTHFIWFFRSFGLFRSIRSLGTDNVARSLMRNNRLTFFAS